MGLMQWHNTLHKENSSLNHHILQVLHLITFSTVLNSLEFVVKSIQLKRTCKRCIGTKFWQFYISCSNFLLQNVRTRSQPTLACVKDKAKSTQKNQTQDSYLILSSSICSARLIIDIKNQGASIWRSNLITGSLFDKYALSEVHHCIFHSKSDRLIVLCQEKVKLSIIRNDIF